jgi:DNA-directed RNA polymerase specialized sigma24 family protein
MHNELPERGRRSPEAKGQFFCEQRVTDVAKEDFAQLVTRAQQGDAEALQRLLEDYGDAIQREIRFCLLDQRLRRVVGESDVFQSVIAKFSLKLREGRYHFDTPGDLVGLLKTMARTHVARLARFWQARRRDLRKNTGLDGEEVAETAANDPTPSSVVARVELLEHALARLSEQDRQILDWRAADVLWPEIARRLDAGSAEALRKRHERALARVAQEVYPEPPGGGR